MNRRARTRLLPLLTLVSLPACGGAGEAEESMVAVADLSTLMFTVVEPAAESYWDAVGWILDTEGETYIRPESPEDWEAVRNAAYQIAESGNLLLVRNRGGADDAAWDGYSRALIEVGQRAIEAAEAHDPLEVFDAGAEVYFVCTSCHAAYSPDILRPNQVSDSLPGDAVGASDPPGSAPGSSGS